MVWVKLQDEGLGFRVHEYIVGGQSQTDVDHARAHTLKTQLKAQGPSRTYNESREEEEDLDDCDNPPTRILPLHPHQTLRSKLIRPLAVRPPVPGFGCRVSGLVFRG